MKFLLWLESIRNPFFDWFFSTITHLGDETAFLLIAIFVFWCVNKRSGYYLMISGFVGTIVNQVMKLACKVPRPWVQNNKLTVVGDAKTTAPGYSFPSGHSQNSVSTFGALFITNSQKWLRIVCIVVAVLVPFSRMYLGVHTPWDVLAGAACALVILIALENLFKSDKLFAKSMPIIVGVLTAGSIAFFIYASIAKTGAPDDVNIQSAFKNAGTMLGCSAGLILVYVMDTLIVKFETSGAWYSQIFKFVGGGAVVFLIKSLLKTPLSAIMGDYERVVRYFLIVAFAGVVWPLTFGFFSKLRIAVLDRFGERVVAFVTRQPIEKAEADSENTVAKTGFAWGNKTSAKKVNNVSPEYTLHTNKDYRKVTKNVKKNNSSTAPQTPESQENATAEVDTGSAET